MKNLFLLSTTLIFMFMVSCSKDKEDPTTESADLKYSSGAGDWYMNFYLGSDPEFGFCTDKTGKVITTNPTDTFNITEAESNKLWNFLNIYDDVIIDVIDGEYTYDRGDYEYFGVFYTFNSVLIHNTEWFPYADKELPDEAWDLIDYVVYLRDKYEN